MSSLLKKALSVVMLKKVAVCLLTICMLNSFLFAQVSDDIEVVAVDVSGSLAEEVQDYLQIQHISWQKVKRARKYEIEVQRLASDDSWVPVDSYITAETEYDLRLEPGTYRFRVSTLNVLNKRGSSSAWAEFDIFESTQPYLIKDSFARNRRYDVRSITRTTADEDGKEIIRVRGVNCFYDDTQFSLIPCDDGDSFPTPFAFMESGKTVNLPVTDRNPDAYTVSLSLDWSRLKAGYYNFKVENSTGQSDSQIVLVLPQREVSISDASFTVDDITGDVCLNLASGKDIPLLAESVQYDTVFTLNPVDAPEFSYPFVSGMVRKNVELPRFSYADGKVSLQSSAEIRTGWYDIKAETPGTKADTKRVLIKMIYPEKTVPSVTDIRGKFNSATQTLALTVKVDKELFSITNTEAEKVFLISETNEYGENKRIQFRKTSIGTDRMSAVFEAGAAFVQPGIYAVLFETAAGSNLYFVDVSSTYKTGMLTLSDDEVTEKFLLPASEEAIALREAARAEAERVGLKWPEYLPAFRNWNAGTWETRHSWDFPSDYSVNSDSLRLSVQNKVAEIPYVSEYSLADQETLDMLRTSEGISFQSMVTSRNNAGTEWNMTVDTLNGNLVIPVDCVLRELSQNVVVWEDYLIQPETITGLTFTVNAERPKEAGWTNALEIYEAKTWSSLEPVRAFTLETPKFLSKAGISAGYLIKTDVESRRESQGLTNLYDDRLNYAGAPSSIRLSLFDAGWFSFNVVYSPAGMGSRNMYGDEIVLSIPNDWFKPYVGYGNSYSGENRWKELFAGAVLFKYVDIRVSSITKEGFFTSSSTDAGLMRNPKGDLLNWNSLWLQVGAEIPLRKKTAVYKSTPKEEAEASPFFTDILAGLSMKGHDFTPSSSYASYLNDFAFGVRTINLKYLANDFVITTRDIPSEKPLNVGSLEFRTDAFFQLPFTIFKAQYTPFAGIGAGYLLSVSRHDSSGRNSQLLFSETAGIKIGKYLSVRINGYLYQDDWKKMGELIKTAPPLAPFLIIANNTVWDAGVTVSIPLRTKK